jgi:hypothetical protein
MMIRLALALMFPAATAALAEDTVFDRAAGLYGHPGEINWSCEDNPHQIDFSSSPPHALFDWATPVEGYDGSQRNHVTYDVLDWDESSITMRMEGETRLTDDGQVVVWILRLTAQPDGYCWGRRDWPMMRCQHQALRCSPTVPTS